MKRLPVALLLIFVAGVLAGTVIASSSQAYQDYLYQFDVYRQEYTDFQIAKNEYAKFKTLTAQTSALTKTKIMLSQRDLLLRAYLLVLNEKLNEDTGLSLTTKQLYQTLIRNEVSFLESHAQLIPSIGSLEDAVRVSGQLESHYMILQVSIRQILTGISLGQLMNVSTKYDAALRNSQSLVSASAGVFSPQKRETINRWLLQITNKRSLYQQKIDALTQSNAQLTATSIAELDSKFGEMSKNADEARQYLSEGASFLGELVGTLQYLD